MSQSAVHVESVEAIKKGFIELNRLPEKPVILDQDDIDGVRLAEINRWLAERVKEYGIQFNLVSGLHSLSAEAIRPAYMGVVGVLDGDRSVILANTITSHASAIQAYDYVVVGLKSTPIYIEARLKSLWGQLFESLDEPQRDLLIRRYGVNLADPQQRQMVLEFYMADLAVLNVKLSFLQRRDSWQRQIVRTFYPSLKWSSQDLHYVLHRVRRNLSKTAKKR
jgi:hypothetical protein